MNVNAPWSEHSWPILGLAIGNPLARGARSVILLVWVTPLLTLLSHLRYVGRLLGGDGNCPQKLWYVNTKNCYLAKKHSN
jgi:hypothetical protein